MKIDKTVLEFLLILFLAFLLPFLFAAFIQWDINPSNWGETARGLTIMGTLFILFFSVPLWLNSNIK